MVEAVPAMFADVEIKAEVLITEWSVVKEPGWDPFSWYNVVDTGGPILIISKFAGVSADASEVEPTITSITPILGWWTSSSVRDLPNIQQRKQIACGAWSVVAAETALLPMVRA